MYGCLENSEESGSLRLDVHPTTFTSNISAAEEAFAHLAQSKDIREVVLNMRDTYRLDSRGLRALVYLQKSLHERGGRLILEDVPLTLHRLLEFTRLDEYFNYSQSAENRPPKLASNGPRLSNGGV